MTEVEYEVSLHTPLGRRPGKLRVRTEGPELGGTLEILGHALPITGSVDAGGLCRISGQIVTLLRSLAYVAEGQITGEAVELTMKTERNKFRLTGTAAKGGGDGT